MNLSFAGKDEAAATYTLDIYARSEADFPNDADAVTHWHQTTHSAVHEAFELSVSDHCRELFKEAQ